MTSSLPNFENALKLAIESAKGYAELKVSEGSGNPFEKELSYSEFREMMTHAMRSGVSARSRLKQSNSRPKLSSEEIMVVELMLTMMCCINALCCNHIQRLVDIIKASETESGRKKFSIVRNYAKSGVVRSIVNGLQNVNNKHMKQIESLCSFDKRKGKEFVERMANAMDAAEEHLDAPVNAYVRYFLMKSSKKTLSTPEDPVVVTCLMICTSLTYLNHDIYCHITNENNFPFIGEVNEYKVFSCRDIYYQLSKLHDHMDIRDTNGNVSKFNANGIMGSEESLSIFSDILAIVYSAEFLDKIVVARSDNDPLIRESCKSIIPSYDSKTMPLSYYKEKYENMYV